MNHEKLQLDGKNVSTQTAHRPVQEQVQQPVSNPVQFPQNTPIPNMGQPSSSLTNLKPHSTITEESIRKSNLRILGYLDGERELEYIRSDIGDTLSMECGQYWAQVVKTAEAFNEENVEAFEKKLSELQVRRDGLRTRIASITKSIGGNVEVRGELPPDLDRRLNLRVQGIATNRVVQSIRELAVV